MAFKKPLSNKHHFSEQMMQHNECLLQVCLNESDWIDGNMSNDPLSAGETVMSFPIRLKPVNYTVLEKSRAEAIIHQRFHSYELIATVMDVFEHPQADFTAITLKANQFYFVWMVFDKAQPLPTIGQQLHFIEAELYLEGWYFYLVFISYTLPFDIPYLFQVYQLQGIHLMEPVFDKPVQEPLFEKPSDYLLEDRQVISSSDQDLSNEILLTLQLKAENAMDELQSLIDCDDMSFFNWSAPFLSTYETQWALNWKERPPYKVFW